MRPDDILNHTQNRNYPLPRRPWKYYQEWHDVLMMHYIAERDYLEKLLPEGLVLDTFGGKAWVSLFVFAVKKLRPRFLPPLPYVSNFNEVNLRTYVTRDGIPGIYMLSIEANKLIDVLIPRWFLGIPYVLTSIYRRSGYFFAENTSGKNLEAEFTRSHPVNDKSQLDRWLTERHALYVNHAKKIYRFDIHHKEWELNEAHISGIRQNYTIGITPLQRPDRCHYSKQARVLVWGRRVVHKRF